jgi:hypothetical protein
VTLSQVSIFGHAHVTLSTGINVDARGLTVRTPNMRRTAKYLMLAVPACISWYGILAHLHSVISSLS